MKKSFIAFVIFASLTAAILGSNDQVFGAARLQGYNALKVFVQIKDHQIMTSDFLLYETEHFTIKYRAEDENIIRETAEMFEKSYSEAAREFDYSSKVKTVVIIYKDQNEFWEYQQSIQGQAVMGMYNMGIIHVLSPNAYETQGQDKMDYFKKNGPVYHEYTHKVVDELAGGNIELWLTEGIALYEEYKVEQIQWAPGFEYEKYFNSREMRAGFMYADETQTYRQSFDMVKYLIDHHGMEKLQLLLKELKSGENTDNAFVKIYGMTSDQFIDSQVYANN